MTSTGNSVPSLRWPHSSRPIPSATCESVVVLSSTLRNRSATSVAGALGEELLDRAAEDLLAVVAEELVGAGVGELDRAVGVDLDDRVRRGLEHGLELLLGLLALGDVADDAAEEARRPRSPTWRARARAGIRGRPCAGRRPRRSGRSGARRPCRRSATRLMPSSCIGRKRSGMRNESALPRISSSVWPNISSAPRFQEMMLPSLVGGHDRVVGGLGDRAEAALGLAQRLGRAAWRRSGARAGDRRAR